MSQLQRSAINHEWTQEVPQVVHDVLRSTGEPLDRETRVFFEGHFGHDFSRVRVHTDARANRSADAVNALAYTAGRNVVFGPGQYAPGTEEGNRLLAHELTHVVQQERMGPQSGRPAIDGGGGHLEQQAQQSARILRDPKPAEKKGGKAAKKKDKPKSTKLTADEVKKLITANNKSSASTELLLCLIWKESGFDPKDKNSKSSATGLMQMTKGAVNQVNQSSPKGVHFTHAEMTDPAKNIQAGTYYLKIRTDWAKGDQTKGLEGFGTGSGYATNILECEKCLTGKPKDSQACLDAIHT